MDNGLQITNETRAMIRAMLADPEIRKAYNTSLGLTAYDLQPQAKSLFPVITPLRNQIPRNFSNVRGDVATHWKAITGINTGAMTAVVSEGRRGGSVTTATQLLQVSYATIGLEDQLTEEAFLAARGFDNLEAIVPRNLLWALMIQEEIQIMGGDNTLALGTTGTPTLTGSTTGGTLTNQTWSVIVVGLSFEGYQRALVNLNVPVPTITRTVVGQGAAIGPVTETVAGGVAQKSANATVATTGSTGSIAATWAAQTGAVAYAVYWGLSGAEVLGAITTINSYVITAAAGGSQTAASLPSADNSYYNNNPIGLDGIWTYINKNLGSYLSTFATGVAGTGTPLTSDGAGGVTELNTAFKSMWDNYRVSPDELWCNSQEIASISKLVISGGGAPLYRFVMDGLQGAAGSNDKNKINAGTIVGSIYNRYTMEGGREIPIRLHPNMPPGSIMGWTQNLPYPMSNVTNVLEVRGQRDYYAVKWPPYTRSDEFGVYSRETLVNYFPPSQMGLTNVAPS
jgi:hypothetical protein